MHTMHTGVANNSTLASSMNVWAGTTLLDLALASEIYTRILRFPTLAPSSLVLSGSICHFIPHPTIAPNAPNLNEQELPLLVSTSERINLDLPVRLLSVLGYASQPGIRLSAST